MAAGAIPAVKKIPANSFAQLLSGAEIALGGALLAPVRLLPDRRGRADRLLGRAGPAVPEDPGDAAARQPQTDPGRHRPGQGRVAARRRPDAAAGPGPVTRGDQQRRASGDDHEPGRDDGTEDDGEAGRRGLGHQRGEAVRRPHRQRRPRPARRRTGLPRRRRHRPGTVRAAAVRARRLHGDHPADVRRAQAVAAVRRRRRAVLPGAGPVDPVDRPDDHAARPPRRRPAREAGRDRREDPGHQGGARRNRDPHHRRGG